VTACGGRCHRLIGSVLVWERVDSRVAAVGLELRLRVLSGGAWVPARRRAVAAIKALSFVVTVPSLVCIFWSDGHGSTAVVAVVTRLLPWVITAPTVQHDRIGICTVHRFARVATINRRLEASNRIKRAFPSVTSRVRLVRLGDDIA
jgi:hypothetical protein